MYKRLLISLQKEAEEEAFQGSDEEYDDEGEDSEQEHWSPGSHGMDAKVQTSLKQCTNKQMEGSFRGKDRSDRATVETVLDPRTRMVGSKSTSITFLVTLWD